MKCFRRHRKAIGPHLSEWQMAELVGKKWAEIPKNIQAHLLSCYDCYHCLDEVNQAHSVTVGQADETDPGFVAGLNRLLDRIAQDNRA